jgi:glucose-1-phosphate cytidylyltransferase
MKVVLFCGGLGTRLREHSDTIPKPLVNVGYRPIIWHLMRYYAHFGHNDFILCLGYRGDMIKEFFLNYNECMSNDFVLSEGGSKVEPLAHDITDWRITFVDTGLHSNIGERLLRVRKHLQGEEAFLANYADGLTDLPLDEHIADFRRREVAGSFVAVRTAQSFHSLNSEDNGIVTGFGKIRESEFWVNGGYFCLRGDIFEYVREGEELVEQPFQRLIERRQLAVYRHHGFWQSMDTFKDKITFDRMEARGDCPWMIWKRADGYSNEAPRSRADGHRTGKIGRVDGEVHVPARGGKGGQDRGAVLLPPAADLRQHIARAGQAAQGTRDQECPPEVDRG